MPHTPSTLTFAGAALSLALSQLLVSGPTLAADPTAVGTPPAPAAEAPKAPAAPSPAESARAKAEERRTAMDAEREKDYAQLRANAAEFGIDLPETPPWKEARPTMPSPPEAAQRQGSSPEEWQAMRRARWEKLREEANTHGIEMPSTPPWEEAEKRRQEMAERFQAYRKTVEEMTQEQREAARAVFGHPQTLPQRRAPQREPYGYGGWDRPCQGDTYGSPYPPFMPYPYETPRYDQGPPPPAQSGQ